MGPGLRLSKDLLRLVAQHGGERLAPSFSKIRFLCNLAHEAGNGHIVDTSWEESHDLPSVIVPEGGVYMMSKWIFHSRGVGRGRQRVCCRWSISVETESDQ